MNMSLANLRNEYKKAELSKNNVKKNPLDQFMDWLNEAREAQVPEPNAMSLATCNNRGIPSVRIVLLKGVEQGNFLFYTNHHSRKGKELDEHPFAAVNFFWPQLERQIRIEGTIERVDEATAIKYFQSRPRESQIGAWSSPQSAIIKNRSLLEERKQYIEEKFKGVEILPKPHQWGGYALKPFMVEFWQGRPGRLHDRIVYMQEENDWKINRLAP